MSTSAAGAINRELHQVNVDGQAAIRARFDYDPLRPHAPEHVGSILRRLLQAGAFGPAPVGVPKTDRQGSIGCQDR